MTARTDLPPEAVGSIALASRRVILTDREVAATVRIADGVIVAVEEDSIAPDAIDLGSDLLIPGLVELHTDHLEPHYAPRPKVLWNPFSAVFAYDAQIASAGITTVFDSLRAGSDGDMVSAAQNLEKLGEAIEKAKETGLLRADHHTHLRCEVCAPDVVDSARAHVERFDVRLMSLMDHTPGQRQFRDEEKLKDYYRGKSGKSEDELNVFFDRRREIAALYAAPHRRALVELGHDNNVALASHDDTTIEHVEEAVGDRMQVAEFPTTVEAAQASHKAGLAVLMGAPNVVRGGSHSGNVSARVLAEAGVLDILSSDYVPISLIEGAFGLADVAAIGLLPGAIRLVTANPAKATGMLDRGEIRPGLRGDVVRIALVDGHPVVREVFRLGRRVC